jgi:exoribonuclease R
MIVHAVSRAILSLAITASNEGTSVCWTVERSTIHITRSLAYDAQRVGISQKTINNMVRIFSWKIDFDRDLERGCIKCLS